MYKCNNPIKKCLIQLFLKHKLTRIEINRLSFSNLDKKKRMEDVQTKISKITAKII